jgi:hypothetical protein
LASKVGGVQYWLDCAEEARLVSEEITHPPSKREMQQIAAAYRRLAKRAQERLPSTNTKLAK